MCLGVVQSSCASPVTFIRLDTASELQQWTLHEDADRCQANDIRGVMRGLRYLDQMRGNHTEDGLSRRPVIAG